MADYQKLLAEDRNNLAQQVAALHDTLRQAKPEVLATQTGATYLPAGPRHGTFHLPFWGKEISLTYPEFVGRDEQTGRILETFAQALLAYYFTLSDGTPQAGRFISFSELPDGMFYTQAFQGYTGNELAKVLGNDREGFFEAATAIGGYRPELAETLGDEAFAFHVFPKVSLLAVFWHGDEDFPPSFRILFDEAASHHLSTDACAIIGSTLVRRLIKAYNQLKGH